METYWQIDNNFANTEGRPPDTMYRDSGHIAYLARWNAAFKLRDKARELRLIDSEDKWNGLMTNFVFQDINNHASE